MSSLSCVLCKRQWVSVSLPASALPSPSSPAPGRPLLGDGPAESVFDRRLEEILSNPALKRDGGEEEEEEEEQEQEEEQEDDEGFFLKSQCQSLIILP